jgi:hypothetical protein
MFAKFEKKLALASALVDRSEYAREARSASYSLRRAIVGGVSSVLVCCTNITYPDLRGRSMHLPQSETLQSLPGKSINKALAFKIQ